MSFGDVGSTAVATGNFYIVVAANQSSSGKPAGTYSDQIQLTLRRVSPSLVLDNTATFNISVITDNGCTIASAPQALSFTYESFQPSDASTSTSFSMICTSGLPFQLSLDAPGGTLLGLNYSLTLPITNSVGTGSNSNYPINGKISYGQSGQCGVASCQASQTRTLTVTY
jgi:spore coat protein U-like protein